MFAEHVSFQQFIGRFNNVTKNNIKLKLESSSGVQFLDHCV